MRAALRAGAWSHVLATIDAMPPAQAGEQTWRYWRARALSAQDRGAEAEPVYVALAAEDGFYPLLAAETLGRGADKLRALPRAAPAADDAWLAAFGARTDVRRAVKLAQLDLRPEMLREWAEIIRGADDETLLRAADYARRQGLYDRAINTAERTAARHDFGLRYLTPYRDEFSAAARDHAVDEALLFAIARQESRFVADIVSSAGAVGLMQLMPATARWVAREQKRSDYRPSASPTSRPTPASARSTSSTGSTASTRSRRSRPPRIMRAPVARRRGATARRWKARSGSSRSPSTKPAITSRRCWPTRCTTPARLNQPYLALTVRLGTVAPRGAAPNGGALALSP